jgi:hypothetical protein
MKNKKIITSSVLIIILLLCISLYLYFNKNNIEGSDNNTIDKIEEINNKSNLKEGINIPKDMAEEKKIFNNYFKKSNDIQLDNKILVAVISDLDIDSEGNLLVTDNVGKNVYLFDEKGRLKKKLSADSCHPGFNWIPLYARFSKNNEILVVNSGPWGFRFKKNGNCLGDMDQTYLASLHVCFKNNGNIIGYYNDYENGEAYLEEMDSLGKAIRRFGQFPKEFKNIISRLEGGGLVCDDNDNIYQLDVTSPNIVKYGPDGKYITTLFRAPSYFRRIVEDIKDYSENPMKFMKQVKNLFENNTISFSLQLLDTKKIMILLLNNKKYGIEIFDLDGKFLLNDELITDKYIIAAKNGNIYVVIQPSMDKNGNLPNPKIEVYKFIY